MKLLEKSKYRNFFPDLIESSEDNYILFVFTLYKGTQVHILGEHHSNGYYGGGAELTEFINEERICVKNLQSRLILVLGLPASGKTTICGAYFGDKRVHLIDDALFQSDLEFQLAAMLETGRTVVLNDPRFCYLNNFQAIFNLAVKFLASASQIAVIYFANNKEQCLSNAHRNGLGKDIERMHVYYDATIAYVESLDCMKHLVPVFNRTPASSSLR